MMNRHYDLIVAGLCLWVLLAAQPTQADYILTIASGGLSTLVVSPGDTFDLDVTITSDAGDVHNSAIFQIIFSASGLIYESYFWASPYETGTIFDDSAPFTNDLPLLLDDLTLSGLPYPDGVVDIEMANVVADGAYDEGLLVTLSLFVPLDFRIGSLFIEVQPDTIANGFNVIPTTAGEVFDLIVIPVPGAVLPLLVAMVACGRRRCRCVN